MKKKVLIFGAGSIGAHHTYSAISNNCEVFLTDIKKKQLNYFKKNLYISRYKSWNKNIKIIDFKKVLKLSQNFDLIVIGTSPFSHLKLLKDIKRHLKWKRILVEKPLLCFNQLSEIKLNNYKNIYCGYNHQISKSIQKLISLGKKEKNLIKIKIFWKEDFNNLLKAHPWINGIENSYLSNINIGGGALHEYSHAMHLLSQFSIIFGPKKIPVLRKVIKFKKIKKSKYDYESKITLKKDKFKIIAEIDCVSKKQKKKVEIYSKNKILVWQKKPDLNLETIEIVSAKSKRRLVYKVQRPDDFKYQMKYLLNSRTDKIINCNNFLNSYKTSELIKKCLKN